VSDYQAWHIAGESAVVELAEVEQVRADFIDNLLQKNGRGFQVGFRVLHPFKSESSRAEVDLGEGIQPARLGGGRDVPEAD
jgi:hypothetical protein